MVTLDDFFKKDIDELDIVVDGYTKNPDILRDHLKKWGEILEKANNKEPIVFEIEDKYRPAFCDTRHDIVYIPERTCKPLIDSRNAYTYGYIKWAPCSNCGEDILAHLKDEWTDNEHWSWPNYCSNCGSKVIKPEN